MVIKEVRPIIVKIAKIGNFWYKFAQKLYTPSSDFYKIWLEGESQVRTLIPRITVLAFKMWAAYSLKNHEKSQFLV